ncbi:MAG: ATP-binding protein [Microthrixaceae bacterium]
MVRELIDNAVDEAAAGHANLVEVTLHRDGSVEVADNGRGIPIGRKDGKRTALEIVFTELHAGGKFGGGAYSSSGGLHGVGASVVNALAPKLVVEVDRDGHTHRLAFVDRVPGKVDAKGRFRPGSTLEKVRKVPERRTGTRALLARPRPVRPGAVHRSRAGR